MGAIDFIFNLAGLLLWVSWRSTQYDPFSQRSPATLAGTIRPAERARWQQWHFLPLLAALLSLRAIIIWVVGPTEHWVGKLDFGVVALAIPFHSNLGDLLGHISLFSMLSFSLSLGVFYLWLLLLSLLAGPDPVHRLVRVQLGWMDRWPRWVKLLLPLVVTGIFWWLLVGLFAQMEIGGYSRTRLLPQPISARQRLESALVIGLGSYLVWKYVLVALLSLHWLNTYVYFGKQPFWGYLNATANTLLRPLRYLPLRFSKVDLAPGVGLAIILILAALVQKELAWLYGRLPF